MPDKAKVARSVRGSFAVISLLLLSAYLIGLVILLTLKPELLSDLRAALSFVVGLAPVAYIVTQVKRRLDKRLGEPGLTVSTALRNFLVDEPLLLGVVWIFLLIGLVVASYFWPYYSVTAAISVEGSPDGTAGSELVVSGQPNDVPFIYNESRMRFQCPSRFSWGDSLKVTVEGIGHVPVEGWVPWTGVPLFHVISGANVHISVKRSIASVELKGTPDEARIEVFRGGKVESVQPNHSVLRWTKNTFLKLQISAGDRYISAIIDTLIQEDTSLQFALVEKSGQLILNAESPGGSEKNGLDTYIKKGSAWQKLEGFEQGVPYPMPAGVHELRVCDLRADQTVYSCDPFNVEIVATETTTRSCVVQLRDGNDCGFSIVDQ